MTFLPERESFGMGESRWVQPRMIITRFCSAFVTVRKLVETHLGSLPVVA
jgi:hypothetical protein